MVKTIRETEVTTSVFNSVINSQVMDCFSAAPALPAPLYLLNRI